MLEGWWQHCCAGGGVLPDAFTTHLMLWSNRHNAERQQCVFAVACRPSAAPAAVICCAVAPDARKSARTALPRNMTTRVVSKLRSDRRPEPSGGRGAGKDQGGVPRQHWPRRLLDRGLQLRVCPSHRHSSCWTGDSYLLYVSRYAGPKDQRRNPAALMASCSMLGNGIQAA